jgi:hypothetical protein
MSTLTDALLRSLRPSGLVLKKADGDTPFSKLEPADILAAVRHAEARGAVTTRRRQGNPYGNGSNES